MNAVTVISGAGLQSEVHYGDGRMFVVDEPASVGVDGVGPDPYTLLLAALGGCISMTVMMYARRKGWKVECVTVKLRQERIHAQDCADCESDADAFVHRIERAVTIDGDLRPEHRSRLLEIAAKCPVHKTLTSPIVIKDMSAAESEVGRPASREKGEL